jgi:hypothetical protein
MRFRSAVIVLSLVAFSGCSAIGYADPKFWLPHKREAQMKRSAEAFAANVRWGRYQQAAQLVDPEYRIDFLQAIDTTENVRYTEYEIMTVEMGPERKEASALVEFKLHRLPSMTEIAFRDEQTWRYEPAARGWYLMPELGLYRDAGKRQDLALD